MFARKHLTTVPFALINDGRLADASHFESGLIADGVCPECKGVLVAKKGDRRIHHLAHYTRTSCIGGLETCLHKVAKQVLIDAVKAGTSFYTPAYNNAVGGRKIRYPELDLPLTYVDCEPTIFIPGEHRRPDALAVWERGKLAIEICVTNPMDDNRVSFYEQAGLDCIEIDLGHLAKQFASGMGLLLSDVSSAVLRDAKIREWKCRSEWIYALLEYENAIHAIPHFGKYTVGHGCTVGS